MSGPVSPPLTVREADGTPSGRPINTIVVSNGDLSISGTIATIDTSGSGTIGGTIADTQVAFGSAADTIKGNDKFRYLESTGQLILTGTADDNAEFVIERSSGSTQRIGIENDSSASPKVTVSVPPNNAKPLMLECHVTDTAVTGGNQGFIFNVSNTSDQSISMINILTTDSSAYDVVFNEDSLNDYDIRMEGSSEQNLFVLKGSGNNIGIGTFPSTSVQRLDVSGDSSDTSTTNPVVRITNELAGQTFTALELSNESDSANSDVTLRMTSKASTDSDFEIEHNSFGSTIFRTNQPNTDTVEAFRIATIANGGMVVNNGMANYDFQIKSSSNTNIFKVDASANRVGIGAEPDSGIFQIQGGNFVIGPASIVGTSSGTPATMRGGSALFNFLAGNTSSGDQVSGIRVFSDDFRARGMMIGKVDDVTVDETVTEQYLFGTQYGRSSTAGISAAPENGGTEYITVQGLGVAGSSAVVINEDSIDMDFRVETNGMTHALFIDGGNDIVSVGATAVTTFAQDPPFTIPNQSGPASYRYIIPSTTSPMTLTNDELQSPLLVHASATALTINLPLDGGVKGQYFQFVSTGGDVTLVPSAVAGDTINGGTASLTRSTNNEIYDCVCIASNTWILSNPA